MRVLTRDETGDVNLLASGQPERQRARGHARVQRREHQCARSVWKGVLGCTFTGWGGSVQTRAPVGSWVATFYRQPIWYWPYALVRTFGRLAAWGMGCARLHGAGPPLGPAAHVCSVQEEFSAWPHAAPLHACCWRLFRARTQAERRRSAWAR
jgi:hypothetical protein